MKKKGFTLVELLVVIAIIALLMGILMPALARVRQIAYRLYCGTNLSGLGKAMLIYCQDYDDEFPRAGFKAGAWAQTLVDWDALTAAAAYGSPGNASFASCFFLLVKYAEVGPKSFVCRGDSGSTEFKVSDEAPGREISDLYNFGVYGIEHCSYAYHTPFGTFGLTTSSDPGMAIAADPNPWLRSVEAVARTTAQWGLFLPTGDRESISYGNSLTHQEEGQNVLFVDGHTAFEKESFCGTDDDNIYTRWTSPTPSAADDMRKGLQTIDPTILPQGRNDSLLLTDNGAGAGR